MITVKATREGLLGQKTASGFLIDAVTSFVALPSVKSIHKHVRVINPANGKRTIAEVLDVGPWNIADDAYVFDGARPQAESGTDHYNRPTNKAGIDLGGRVWQVLGMTDNAEVQWEFVEP